MTRRILVTRPEPGAAATAARLVDMGLTPVILPLTRIVPVERAVKDPACDAVAVTSVNAVRHASPSLLSSLRAKTVFTVGDASALAAEERGFADVRSAGGTAVDLVALMGASLADGARVLHLAGRERTEGFAEALAARGFGVEIVETYRADKVSYSTDFILRLFDGKPISGAIVLSSRAGAFLAEIAGHAQVHNFFENAEFFCISEKAGASLRPLFGDKVRVSAEPTEESVLRLLVSQG